jgi:hypothetical protein
MLRRDDGVIDTRAGAPADAPTWPRDVRVRAVCYVLSYAVQPVAFLGLTGTGALLYGLGRPLDVLVVGLGAAGILTVLACGAFRRWFVRWGRRKYPTGTLPLRIDGAGTTSQNSRYSHNCVHRADSANSANSANAGERFCRTPTSPQAGAGIYPGKTSSCGPRGAPPASRRRAMAYPSVSGNGLLAGALSAPGADRTKGATTSPPAEVVAQS